MRSTPLPMVRVHAHVSLIEVDEVPLLFRRQVEQVSGEYAPVAEKLGNLAGELLCTRPHRPWTVGHQRGVVAVRRQQVLGRELIEMTGVTVGSPPADPRRQENVAKFPRRHRGLAAELLDLSLGREVDEVN